MVSSVIPAPTITWRERENGAAGEGISAKPIHENKEKSKFKKL